MIHPLYVTVYHMEKHITVIKQAIKNSAEKMGIRCDAQGYVDSPEENIFGIIIKRINC